MSQFKHSFWSQKQHNESIPNFQTGFITLHQKLTQSKVENEEIITFFKDRILQEENYGNKLIDQSKVQFRSTGFGRDDGATLKSCFEQLKNSTGHKGLDHIELAQTMTNSVLKPLQDFHEEYKQNIAHSKLAVESMLKQLEGLGKETDKSRQQYQKKCREKEASPLATSFPLGSQIMTRDALDHLVRRMKQEMDLKDCKVPILGTYKNTSTGEDIAVWLQHNLPQCKDSPAMADVIGQQLIQPYNVLRLVGQRGNKFTASSTCYYQWRTEEEADEVEKADRTYRSCVKKLDQMRMVVEGAMFAHLNEMEQLELDRIQQIKQMVHTFIDCLTKEQEVQDMQVFYESLKPDQDIQFIIQQYTVSGFSPKAILYNNYYHSPCHDQIFGISLEEMCKASGTEVPAFVSTLLSAIQKGADKLKKDKAVVWSTPCPLDRVHAACTELNGPPSAVTDEMLDAYDPALLVAILRYFMLELPDCVMTYEMYDPIGTILKGDEESKVASLTNLISTLPSAHFFTLQAIIQHLQPLLQTASSDTVHDICQSLGPHLVRSQIESYTTLNSKIPTQWMHTLLEHNFFSPSTHKLHAESEKRRKAKPIVVETDKKNGLMSLIVDETKWNTMKGVFQRSPSSPTVEPKSSISLSFGSTVITQSPPSSPKIMFDGEDIFNDKVDAFFDDD
ncbi:hypothetical protein BY458DRAFT_555626 [Sporodiniella umbellata]|nr:hypothetical protein BY458DRAFT_555626 [Sporodiniella umbellata]